MLQELSEKLENAIPGAFGLLDGEDANHASRYLSVEIILIKSIQAILPRLLWLVAASLVYFP